MSKRGSSREGLRHGSVNAEFAGSGVDAAGLLSGPAMRRRLRRIGLLLFCQPHPLRDRLSPLKRRQFRPRARAERPNEFATKAARAAFRPRARGAPYASASAAGSPGTRTSARSAFGQRDRSSSPDAGGAAARRRSSADFRMRDVERRARGGSGDAGAGRGIRDVDRDADVARGRGRRRHFPVPPLRIVATIARRPVSGGRAFVKAARADSRAPACIRLPAVSWSTRPCGWCRRIGSSPHLHSARR